MTVEKEVARLAAIVEAALGPNGTVPEGLKEIRTEIRKMDERQVSHHVRIDRLEQNEKRRSKWISVVGTAWIGLAVAWVWDRLKG